MEGSERLAACDGILRCARVLACSLGVQMDKRIQFRLLRLNAFKMEFDDFDGRSILGANFVCDFR